MQNQVKEFSLHIIERILLLLPSKCIVRLKIVSKNWNKLISDPWFIKEHSRNSKQNPKFLHITTNTDVSNKKESCIFNFITTDNEGRITQKFTKTIDQFRNKPDRIFRVLGYNDLVCFRALSYGFGESIYLCNPTTQQVLSLPKCSPGLLDHSIIGFGYSVSSEEYKVARLFFSQEYEIRCEIFSLGTNNSWKSIDQKCLYAPNHDSWKVIDQKCLYAPNHDTSIFINDCFYWTVEYIYFSISLDTKSYMFNTHSKPELIKEKTIDLLEIKGELGICGYNFEKGIVKVYKVEDYENWIWNEVYKIDLNFNDAYTLYPQNFCWPPGCMVKEELMFFPVDSGRVSFNFETRKFIWHKPNEDVEEGGLETAYHESILSL